MVSEIRTALGALALALLIATPAAAQMPNINLMPELQSKTPDEIERDEKREKAYRESLRKIPDSKAAADPWGGVRGGETNSAAKPKTNPSPKRAKADGPAAN